MICIVPLAGPDLPHAEHGFRPLVPVAGRPLIETALEGRSWRRQGLLRDSDYVFVVRDVPGVERLHAFLRDRWPGCRIVSLSHLTGGALLSALAGVALAPLDQPVIIDLADILFDCDYDFGLPWPQDVGAVTPCFPSEEPCYSYLREENGHVVEAAEKRVISNRASAGVYAFRSPSVYLAAAAHSIEYRHKLSYNGIMFVCPAMNGVLNQGLRVVAPETQNVRPVSKQFH